MTNYDELLSKGYDRFEARETVNKEVFDTLNVMAGITEGLKKYFMKRTLLILIISLVVLALGVFAFVIKSAVDEKFAVVDKELDKSSRIMDRAGLLTIDQADTIFNLIKKLDIEVGSQVAIITVDSLYGRKIEEFSINMAESLKLGRRVYNDGVLITVSLKDRKTRIEVGKGLENVIKDEIAAEIIREELEPKFREGNYAGGLFLAVDKICKMVSKNKHLIRQKPLVK